MLTHIKTAVFILTASLILMFCGILYNGQQTYSMSRGNYFFEQTKNNSDIKTILISFTDGKKISLARKGDFWRIKEADDYFAAFAKINALINLITNTTIYRADLIKGENLENYFQNALKIETLDSRGNIVDSARISLKQQNNKYHYASKNGNDILYQLSNDFSLSPQLMDWVQMPILKIDYAEIKRIASDNFETYRQFQGGDMLNADTGEDASHVRGLISNLWYLSAEDIRHAVHFDRNVYKKTKSYEITLFNGAVYGLDFYAANGEYWLAVRLGREKISSDMAAQLLEENSILYDGWYFKIGSDKGNVITGFVL